MRAGVFELHRSSRVAVAAAAAALLAACGTREPRATPFAITVTGPSGAPVTGPNPILVQGPVTARAATSLVVDDPQHGGAVTIAFDPAASPGVAFPPQLQGASVAIEVEESDTIRSPAGALLPYPALRVFQQDAPSGASFQFFLGEGDLVDAQGLPVPPPLLSPGDADVPGFSVFADNTQFEPSSCGLYYYDLLRVDGDAALGLRKGEQGTVHVDQRVYQATGVQVTRPPWNVRHVTSFHRIDCSRPPRAWTQLAAWRDPEGG